MELWIRSQDRKRLIKVAYLELEKDDYGFYILGREDKFSGNRLGIYKSEERALEVLDEIQEFIENRNTVEITQDIHGITSEVEIAKRVYKMPKE